MPDDKVIPVRVALRCRPLIAKEENEGCQSCLQFMKDGPQLILGKDKSFTYDYVFTPETPQVIVYEQAISRLVKGIFKGYNATVLAYGQTGSGKTYSMGGSYGVCTDLDDDMNGVIPRVIQDLYDGIDERSEEFNFTVKVTFIELYKDDLNDLLATTRVKDAVQIREENNGGIKLVGLIEKEVHSMADMLLCLDAGSKCRTTGATAMNSHSSRSHAIFSILVEKSSKRENADICCAKFHLVDLAGSERAKKTHAEGERFKEGVNINKGLLALGNVISALGEEGHKRSHIPYRDSKLTRLLQDSLGGNSHTVMVACVSPADSNMEETLSTLRYADRARKIKNKPVVNRDPQSTEIMRLKKLVELLQDGKVLSGMNTSSSSQDDASVNLKEMQHKLEDLETEKSKVTRELRTQMAQNTLLMEQNIHLEMRNEKLSDTLDIVKQKTGMSSSRLETTQSLGNHGDGPGDDNNLQSSILKAIHEQINAAEKDQTFTLGTILEEGSTGTTGSTDATRTDSGDDSIIDEEQMTKQADFQRRLADLNDQLYQKETVVKQMVMNDEAMAQMKEKYETDKTDLMKQIDKLNNERDTLVGELQTAKVNTNSSKIAEQRRKRLKELEEQLMRVKKTLKEQSKVVKLKEQSDQQLKKMQSEVMDMKQKRVKLMKQMKEEAENFRKFKQEKDKEVMQLKAKDRKRQLELLKMQRTNDQQKNILRRKAEEAAAANKRLKDALCKQRAVHEERNRKQEVSDMSCIGARVRKWLSHELEVLVSMEDVKRHLEGLKHDRADLVMQKKQLHTKLENGPSPAKRSRSSDGSADDSDDTDKLKRDLEVVQADIDLRSVQISDLQEKVVDAGHDEKTKSRWQHVHTMVEAKCAMKHLLNEAVNARVDESKEKTRMVESQTQQEALQVGLKDLEKELRESKDHYETEILSVQKTYENKMLFLMNQLKNSSNLDSTQDDELRKRLQFQEQQIEKLMKYEEELDNKVEECERLKKELTAINYKVTLSGNRSLMPGVNKSHSSSNQEDSRFFSPAFLKHKPRSKRVKQPDLLDDEEEEESIFEEDSEEEEELFADPDWKSGMTPGVNRENNVRPSKRRVTNMTMTFKTEMDTTPLSGSDFDETPIMSTDMCKCKGKCIRQCPCKEATRLCTSGCGCVNLRCSNRPKDAVPEEDSSIGSTFNTTFNLETSTSADDKTSIPMNPITTTNNKPSRLLKKKSSEMLSSLPETEQKENLEEGDPLNNGGVNKKRKLHSGKSYFPNLKT